MAINVIKRDGTTQPYDGYEISRSIEAASARLDDRIARATQLQSELKITLFDNITREQLEEQYTCDLLPRGILGLNADYINQYVRYLADRRVEELGFATEYDVSNPAKWMVTANDTLQLVNLFESINTSYEVNARAN